MGRSINAPLKVWFSHPLFLILSITYSDSAAQWSSNPPHENFVIWHQNNFRGKCNNSPNLSWIWLPGETGSLQLYHKLRPSIQKHSIKIYVHFIHDAKPRFRANSGKSYSSWPNCSMSSFFVKSIKDPPSSNEKKSNNFRVHHNKMGKKVLIKGTQFSNFWNWNCSVALPSFDRVALTAKMYRIFWVARQAFFPPNHHRSFLSEIS